MKKKEKKKSGSEKNPQHEWKKNIMMKTLLLITYYPGYYNDMGDYEIELNVVNKVWRNNERYLVFVFNRGGI